MLPLTWGSMLKMRKAFSFSLIDIDPKRFFSIAIALGAAIVALTGVIFYEVSISQLSSRMHATVEYIASQSLIYDSYNDASTMKSVLRATENASQLARNVEKDGIVTPEKLRDYTEELRLTGAIALDDSGAVVGAYSSDEVGAAELKSIIENESVLDVASHPTKVYSTRLQLADGSCVDLAAACRTDAPGIMVAYYHTSKEFADKYTLTLQNMLLGYDTADNGTIVIERDGELEATNDASVKNEADDCLTENAANIVKAIKDANISSEIAFVRQPNGAYLGMASKARDYYVYTYVSLGNFFSIIALAMSIVLVAYSCTAGAIWMICKQSRRAYLEERLEEAREHGEQLAAATRSAQSANSAKTEFLQRMSHDIRTPINGIRGMVEVADACADDLEKQADCRRKIWSASNLLLDLVNEVLDMSKLESGKVELDQQPLNLNEMLFELYEILERQATAHGVKILRTQTHLEHPYVLASPTHVKRLVMNVIGNAVKYNKQDGTVELSCEELSCENGIATYRITVADTGIGMSEQFQQRLFEPFAQEHQEVAANTPGTGLGMPIAKSLAEIMGGNIEFESELGVGTTVRITLPMQINEKQAADTETPNEEASIAGMHVLLAEDNELNREIAEFLLHDAGAYVTSAADGKQALETFEASQEGEFDVIVMDVMMPTMNGYEATRAIRSLARDDAASVPIIALTANAFAEDRQKARAAGMNDHIAKPLNSKLMIYTIAKHVGKKQAEQ